MASLEILISVAEIAVAIAGFSAIVIVMRRSSSGTWEDSDVDQFHGMLAHAGFAVLFCFLPTLINFVVQDAVTTLHIACAVLGVQIILHSFGVMFLSTTNALGFLSLGIGVLVGLSQFSAFTDWGVHRELDIYLVGIIWHVLQAGLLFVFLIWISREDR